MCGMMNRVILRVVASSLWCSAILCQAHCPLDHLCSSFDVKEAFVSDFCLQHNGTMAQRCCFSNKNQSHLIGLDMQNCNLSDVNITNIPSSDVEIIDLHDNSIKYVNSDDFLGFVKLNILYLPLKTECPGGVIAWNHTYNNDEKNFTECIGQKLACVYLNVSCTINGECLNKGPGAAKCVCKPNHYGYKCLQQGVFPITTFVVSLCVPCVLLSAALWFYLRWNVISEKEE